MANARIQGLFAQLSARIDRAAGRLPEDEKASVAGNDGTTCETRKTVDNARDTRRAIERWANEGGAGGDASR